LNSSAEESDEARGDDDDDDNDNDLVVVVMVVVMVVVVGVIAGNSILLIGDTGVGMCVEIGMIVVSVRAQRIPTLVEDDADDDDDDEDDDETVSSFPFTALDANGSRADSQPAPTTPTPIPMGNPSNPDLQILEKSSALVPAGF
jgi:hypothetical protein